MNFTIKRFLTLFSSILWLPSVIYAHGGMMGHENHGPRGPMSSSYSSYTSTQNTSTGTSDCIWGGPNCRETFGRRASQAVYVARAMDQITEEAAQGKGGHLEALAQLMGCPLEQASLFSRELQRKYSFIFSKSVTPSSQEEISYALKRFDQVIASHKVLRQTCRAMG